MKKVFVIGSINQDLVMYASVFPRAGETVLGRDFFINSGGKGANQAVASAKQGAETYLLGSVGNDVFGTQMLASLRNYGVKCDYVSIKEGPSGVAIVMLDESDNRIIVSPGANHQYTIEEARKVLETLAQPGDIVVFQLEIQTQVVEALIPFAKSLGLTVIFNPAPMIDNLKLEILHDVDLLVLNEWEARTIAHYQESVFNYVSVITKLMTIGAKSVIITLGESGGVYYTGGQITRYQACKTTVSDTTGAGDAFVGSIAASLTKDLSMEKAIKRASQVAALTVSRPGAQQAIPTKEEVDLILGK